ncbi:MAG: Mycothiol acetyltransferase [Polaribacter sp. SA4-10]|nr:MAG: Mycothiol acetyltransferase [Polaribacter sp. SA4-10]
MTPLTIDIIPFESQYATHFYDLNVAWLEKYFYVEPYDEKVLRNPKEYILQNGGFIFFAKVNSEIVGTVAFINQGTYFELSKMAVKPAYQGKKIGMQLMDYCIEFARAQQWDSITLYSHRSLVAAIFLYKKIGFEEVALEEDVHYERADIKMRFKL